MTSDDFISSRISKIFEVFTNGASWPIEDLAALSQRIADNFTHNQKVAFVGNGGSAAEAMHLAAEFTGKCVLPHKPWPAICLNESQSALTAIANDYGVDYMFSRQVEAHLSKNDILVALSTSGASMNIHRAISSALEIGVECHLWTGALAPDINSVKVWRAPSSSTPRIQEVHLAWGHILAERVEDLLAN